MRKTCISREAAGREGVKFNPEVSRYFESPATTFGLVKANRFTADLQGTVITAKTENITPKGICCMTHEL